MIFSLSALSFGEDMTRSAAESRLEMWHIPYPGWTLFSLTPGVSCGASIRNGCYIEFSKVFWHQIAGFLIQSDDTTGDV